MPDKRNIKVVLTGGHAATTALATVEELVRRTAKGQKWDIFWIGSEVSVEGKDIPTLESKIFPSVGVKTFAITAGRIQRRFTFWSIPSLLKIPLGFIQALGLLFKIRPDVILSFGGYAAFPVVVAGWLFRIPVVVHEQTCAAGRANRASSFFAKKIALAREESRKYFPASKIVITGNPILTQIRDISPKRVLPGIPTIFITCGSRGAQRINKIVGSLLENLLAKHKIIHLTGPFDFEEFSDKKNKLAPSLKKNYEIFLQVDPMKIDNIYRESDVIIGRAGANTVSEIIYVKRPSILIPIPWTYLDEQRKNAEFAQNFGIAKMITEDNLSATLLAKEIDERISHWQSIVNGVLEKESPDKNAAEKLADLVYESVS